MVRELYPGFEFENIVIHMATPEQVFAEYEFTAESSANEAKYSPALFQLAGCEGREDQVVAGGAQRSSIGPSDLFTRNTPIARHDLTRRHL